MARYPHLRTTAIAIAVLLVAACGSDDDVPDGLRDIRDTEPADTDPDEADDPDGGDTPNDDSTDARDEPAEPDEPDPEPDSDGDGDGETFDGVTVPDDALQVNDDLDMPPDQQLEVLELVRAAFEYTVAALDSGVYDREALETFYAAAELEGLLASLERFEAEGLRQISDGTATHYIRVVHHDEGAAIVDHCTTAGPNDGIVDSSTGEYTFQRDVPARVISLELALAEPAADSSGWRIIDGAEMSDVACP